MDELQKLYDLLVSEGLYTNSFDEFKVKWSGEKGYQDKVFDVVSKDGFYTKDKGSFISKYGVAQEKKNSQPPLEVAATELPLEDGLLESAPTEKLMVGPMGMTGIERTTKSKPKDGQGFLLNVVSSLDKGIYNLPGEAIKGVGTLLEGVTGKGFVSDALNKFGSSYLKAIEELTPQDESFKGSLSDQFGQAFGQVAGMVLTSGASQAAKATTALSAAKAALASQAAPKAVTIGGAVKKLASELLDPAAVSMGLAMGQGEFERAKQAGATDEQAFEAFYKNAAVGSVLEKIPVMQFLKRFEKASAGGIANYLKTKSVSGLVGGVEEMTTEVLQQLYANQTAQDIYNINQNLFEGVGESGGIGFGVGFLLNAMGANAKLLRNQGRDAEAQVIENQMAQFESKVESKPAPIYKVNGIKVELPALNDIIDNTSAEDLTKLNIDIENDVELRDRLQDKIVTSSIMEQVREANPDLNEPSLKAITELEKQLQKLEGNKTQSGKDKAAAVRQQIKNIQDNPLTEEVKVEEVVTDTTDKTKTEQDAIQEQSTATGVPSTEQPQMGLQEVGEGNAQPQGTPPGTQEVVAPEPGQEEIVPVVEPEITESEEERQRYDLSEKVFSAQKAIGRATESDADAAIEEYKAAKKELADFEAGVEKRKDKKRAQNNVKNLIESENKVAERAGYEYTDLYQQDPRLAALQSAKDMVEFAQSEDAIAARIAQGQTAEEAKESGERVLAYSKRDIADLEADLQANPVVSSKTQTEVIPDVVQTPRFVRDLSVLLTPATVRAFSPITKRIKKLSINYDKLVKEYSKKKDSKILDKIKKTEQQILNDAKQEIIDAVAKVDGVSVKFSDNKRGLWDKFFEPSFNMTLSITPQADTKKVSDLLFDFSEKYSQDAFILEADSDFEEDVFSNKREMPLTEFDESGLMHYPQIIYTFDTPITDEQVADLSVKLEENGLEAFSINNNQLQVSVIKFFSPEEESNLNNDEQYEERTRDFDSKTIATTKAASDVLGSNGKGTISIRIKKSSYQGAVNEKTTDQTRQYDRSDVLEAFQKSNTKVEKLAVELAALRQKEIELQKKGEKLSPEDKKRFDELNKVVQPIVEKTFEVNKKLYEDAKTEVEGIAQDAIKEVDASISPFPIKRPSRASVKTIRWYNTFTEKLGDGARVNIVVDNEANADKVFKIIDEKFPGDKEVRRISDTTELGYPKKLIEIRTSNGVIAEIQVITNEGYLAKDGLRGFTGDENQKSKAKQKLEDIRSRLGWNIPDGLGHYFYEIERDVNIDNDIRDEAKKLSNIYYKLFTDKNYSIGESFMNDVLAFKKKIDAADKTTWDKGNEGKAPDTLIQYESSLAAPVVEEEVVEQYEPIAVKDISYEPFTKYNATDYEEGEREADNGRTYTYLASITIPVMDAEGNTIGYLKKLVSEDDELSFNAANLEGEDLDLDGYETLGQAKQALVDDYNNTKKKEFDKEAKKAAKQKVKEAEKAAKKAEATAAKEAAKAAKAAAKAATATTTKAPAVTDTLEDLLDVDVTDKDNLDKIFNIIDKADKAITNRLRGGANDALLAIPLSTVQIVIKAVKALVKGGMLLRDAIKKVAADNNLTEKKVVDILNTKSNIKKLYRGTNTEEKSSKRLTWYSENKDFAKGFGDILNEKNVELGNIFDSTNPSNVQLLIDNGIELYNEYDDSYFNNADDAASYSDTWDFIENSYNAIDTIESLGFNSIKILEGGSNVNYIVIDEGGLESIDKVLDLDVKDKNNLNSVLKFIESVDKAISNRLRGGANDALLAIPLSTVQLVIKTLKTLVRGGMILRDAIKKVAADNSVSQQIVKDILNISEIQDKFDALMLKVDAMVTRQRSRGTTQDRMVSNIDTYVRKSEVYQEANDAQKKILEREARARAGAAERRAPSIGRVLGVLADITNISRAEKLLVIKRIRELSKDAAKDLAKELRSMASTGTITLPQAANVLARFGKVNLLNEVSVANFVDYMARVFANAEYAAKMKYAKSMLASAKKNVTSKIGIADGLITPLMKLFSVNPSIIPESVLDKYISLVKMFGEKAAVLTLREKYDVLTDVNDILKILDEEQSLVDTLLDVVEQYQNKVLDANGNLDLEKTIKNMIDDGVITEDDADMMRKYRTRFVPRASTKMTQQELDDEKNELLDDIDNITVNGSGLSTRDERKLAKEISELIKTPAVRKLSNTELKNLLKVIDNINNNYITNYAQLLKEKMDGINETKPVVSSILRSVLLPLSKAVANIKTKLSRRKNATLTMIERNPLFYIDQVFGDFKTKDLYNALLLKASIGDAAYKSELKTVQELLEDAEEKVAKSFGLKVNETLMSKYKMMTYMIQLEYLSNPGNEQVNEAAKYINETIKFIESSDASRYTERDVKMFEAILNDFAPNGEVDINKLYNSFNDAEKAAIKTVRELNESLKEKAEFTAAIIRGDRISPLNNYVHLNVLQNPAQADASSSSPSDIANMSNMMNPSTKAKSLIKRTRGAKALNFDIFASAQRGAKFVLMDYNLTSPIRTARMTLNNAKKELEVNGRIPKEQRDKINALESAFRRAVENLLLNAFTNSTTTEEVIDYISKQGYRAVLAGTTRFTSELMSNIGFAMITDPKAMSEGVKYFKLMTGNDALLVLQNVLSTQTTRIIPTSSLSGSMVDTSILRQSGGVTGGRAINPVANKINQIFNRSGKKYLNAVEFVADTLISTPDKLIMRPMWFGSFANAFKAETGVSPDFDLIARNNEAYMSRYKEAITNAKTIADGRVVLTGATDNAFMGVLKGTRRVDDSAAMKAFNNFNNYMTKFLIFEYITARTGIAAARGNGMITKKQGYALIAGVTTRMTVYTLITQVMGTGLMGLLFGGDDEEETEKSFFQKFGQQLTSALTSLLFGRDFGQGVRGILNIGLEEFNKEYLDGLREGEYDPYKDAIQYPIIPPERKGRQTDLGDILLNMSGSFSPAMKTADFMVRKALEAPKKEEEAIERTQNEIGIRIPLEVAGNAGLIPLYKDVKKVVMNELYKDLRLADERAADKKRAAAEKLQGYKNSEDMKRYAPELWKDTFGPNSKDYDVNEAKKKLKREKAKIERERKDDLYNYTPKKKGGTSTFGSQEKRKSSFGSDKKSGARTFGRD